MRPITRAAPPSHGMAKSFAAVGCDPHRVPHPFRHLGGGELLHRRAALEDEVGLEALEVGQEQQVGHVAGRDGAVLPQAVPERRVDRPHHERVLGGDAELDRAADDVVHVPLLGDVLGLAVVGAEGEPVRPELRDERDERLEVPRGGRLPHQHPHPRAEALAPLLGRVALVVGADACCRVGLQAGPEETGRVPVHVRRLEPELLELVRVAGDDAREIHHLGEADHAPPAKEPLQVADA